MNRFLFLAPLLALNGLAQQSPAPQLRLPESVRPVHYSADLTVTPGEDHFSGVVRIDLRILQPVSTVWLYAKAVQFHSAAIESAGGNVSAAVEPGENDFVALRVPENLSAGTATLTIHYTGEISRVLTDGAFQQKQGDDWYVFTKFEPVTARRVFPCFDEPSYKVPWQLTLHIPKDLKAFSNTPVLSEENEKDGRNVIRFKETKPLPSYLIAFAVGPFDIVPTGPVGKNRRPSRIIVPHGRGAEAQYAASITPKLIEMLETYFGTPYPYEKLDQIVVPLTTAWGAMENAGLIAYGDFLLSPPRQDSDLSQHRRASTMEHEMSHQWFGDLVTTAWWDDIWLNEAFASWLSTKLLDEWKPEWNIKADAARSIAIMRADSLTTSRKIRQPIESPGDIGNAFDGITYGKGEAVIGMFENYVGPDKFQEAVRLYLSQHAWGNATAADLLSAIDEVAGSGKGAAFSTFLNQVGFPLVHASVICTTSMMSGAGSHTAGQVRLTQQRFLPAGSPGTKDVTWQVPVCADWGDSEGKQHGCMLLSQATDTYPVKGCPTWLFADANAAGYYAVLYEPWSLSNEALSKLTPAESAAALRNIQLLFASGVGDPEQELNFTAQFSHSSDPGLARQAATTISGLSDLVPADLKENYAQLIRSLSDAKARELGWNPKAGESEDVRLLRIEIVPLVATRGADAELQSEAAELARQWLKDRNSLDSDMVAPVLATAAWNGDRAFFDQLVNEIKSTKIQRERLWMIAGLRGFQDPAIKRSALDLLFGSGIDPRELQGLLQNAPQDTREVVWDFVKQNFDRLNSTLPSARGVPFGATLPLSASGFCDSQHQEELEAFFRPRIASLPGGARNLANTLERIRLCSARAGVVQPAVTNFLKSYHQTRDGHSDSLRIRSY